MAGTSKDTSDDRLLLYAVRALVTRYCGDLLEAERLIIQYANKGHFGRHAWSGGHIDPRRWGACHPELGFYIPVDFERSVVRHICLPAAQATSYTTRLALDDLLEPYMDRSNTEMREVCLARDDVLSMLRELGLLSLEKSTSEQAQQGQFMSEVELARGLIEIAFPNGEWQTMKPGAVEYACSASKAVKKRLAELKRDMPKRDSFARATGHRK